MSHNEIARLFGYHMPARVKWICAALLGATCLAACGRAEPPEPSTGHRVEERCPQPGDGDYYFPASAIADSESRDRWYRDEYSHLLALIEAEPLWCGANRSEAYRLLWLPAAAAPVVVSATRRPDGWLLVSAEYTVLSLVPFDPRGVARIRLARRSQRVLADEAFREWLRTLDTTGFWNTLFYKSSQADDATAWTIEGRRDDRYRVVTRVSSDDQSFEQAARVFVRLSGMALPDGMK